MNKKIVITGATGLIGKKISKILYGKDYDIIIFSRNPEKAKIIIPYASEYVMWNPSAIDKWVSYLDNIEGVIHLAGENVLAKRWSEKQKKIILNSRLIGTRSLVNAINAVNNKPKTFISASAIGYYGFESEEVLDELSLPGNDFLSIVTQKWEKEASDVTRLGLRWVSIRIGIVLDKNEGAFAKMIIPFKFFVGGAIGKGDQGFSWIHIDDLAGLFVYAFENNNIKGSINGTSPDPISMKQFSTTLGKVMKRPSFLNVPSFVIKFIVGKASEIVLNGTRVFPKKALEYGFKFKYTNIENALEHLLKS